MDDVTQSPRAVCDHVEYCRSSSGVVGSHCIFPRANPMYFIPCFPKWWSISFSCTHSNLHSLISCAMSEETKDVSLQSVLAEGGVQTTPGHEEVKKGTQRDQKDMVRMGKVQETRVRAVYLRVCRGYLRIASAIFVSFRSGLLPWF